jgi:hypothetical protein
MPGDCGVHAIILAENFLNKCVGNVFIGFPGFTLNADRVPQPVIV